MSVQQAKYDLVDLRKRVELLQQEVEDAENRAAKIGAYLELAPVYGNTLPIIVPGPQRQRRRTRGPNGYNARLVQAVKSYIREQNSPQPTRKLLAILAAQGFPIRSVNKPAFLSGLLSRSAGLRSDRRNGWWLAEWDQRHARTNGR